MAVGGTLQHAGHPRGRTVFESVARSSRGVCAARSPAGKCDTFGSAPPSLLPADDSPAPAVRSSDHTTDIET